LTPENRRLNASAELERARTCLAEAEHLHRAGFASGATSRAYYPVFHAARALLFSIGLEPTSHRAAVSLIGEHFVRSERLSAELGRLLSRMQRDREDADYETGAVFTKDQSAEALSGARMFLDRVAELLRSQ
jgi:uncharacterized protein (UPF0332 family)